MKYDDILTKRFLDLIKSIKGYENIIDLEEKFFKKLNKAFKKTENKDSE